MSMAVKGMSTCAHCRALYEELEQLNGIMERLLARARLIGNP